MAAYTLKQPIDTENLNRFEISSLAISSRNSELFSSTSFEDSSSGNPVEATKWLLAS